MEEDLCFLCSNVICDDTPYVTLTAKGLTGIINASKQRGDTFHELFNPMPTGVKVHKECRRGYTNQHKIKNEIKLRTSQEGIPSNTSRTLRGSGYFNFKDNCMFCGHIITSYEERKKMSLSCAYFPVSRDNFESMQY